ncbi:MAG: hypothetical protein A2Z42_00810 [Candidatus Woykebacteria bacterium RBG_19FT_COMBO_43_10]|uniref:Mechanosensitive ion channel protein MscS n=1 Tax=Candidatus Woykebacteria bacterium RBG_19FT_COMBO_43_10 TaxID=1802598 RepID=A0A1G1WGR5_9BACT|nr:MAG: hypothetical protein A2Z42_00810 [Candidatus Woykebacteria bacterium RBG_19FT_COMBO_43_10]
MGVDISTSRIIFIALVTLVAWIGTQLLTRGLVVAISTGTPTGKRLKTLTDLIKAAVSTLIIAIAGFMILEEFGFNLAPLIASAGIVGLAIGFGAQALVKDIISGAFLLAENQFSEGDEVEISGKRGKVEKITLRTVRIRDTDGTLHTIPNGSITMVSNFSKK